MELSIKAPQAVSQIHNQAELKQRALQGIIIIGYLKGELSKMEAAEALGLDYEGITNLLYELNISSQTGLPDDLDKAAQKNMEKLAGKLGINLK